MKKSLIFGAALMLVGAFSFQSCANESKPGVPTEAAIDNGTELADVIVSHAKDGVLALPKNVVELNVSADIDLSQVEIQNDSPLILNVAGGVKITLGKNLNNVSINGNAEAPATIEATEAVEISGTEEAPIGIANANFIIANNFTLENAIIDASKVSDPFIALTSEPTVAFLPKSDGTGDTDYYGISNILLKNVTLTGVKNSIIYDNDKKYCVVDLTIDDCVIGLATEATMNQAIISFKQGGVKDFAMKNSTVYQTAEAENNYFLRYNNSARLDRYGFDKNTETQSISYLNNTFYNVNKNGQWGNYGGIAGQAYSEFHVVGNIWVDCGNGQISRRLLGGRNASSYTTCEFNNNTYWFNGAAETGNTNYDAGTQLATDPAFKDAANADFTPTGADQVSKKTGDPRWFAAE